MQQSRREFLSWFSAVGGCFVLTAWPHARAVLAGGDPSQGNYLFPQGVASADPQADAIVVWTRVIPLDRGERDVSLKVQFSRDREFRESLLDSELSASAEYDYTVRVFVDGLEPDRWYYYRFIAPDGTLSRIGRTRTAPAPDAMRPLNVAVFSCQHYSDGFFSAYRRLMIDNDSAPQDRKIDVILHLGDFIYEFPEVDLYKADGTLVDVRNPDGSQRIVDPLPSGGPDGNVRKAETVDDFRHLYRTYLLDRDLQEARASFPFIHTWDDHELINDCWQGFVLEESIHQRRMDANQAWFEYIPAALTRAAPGSAGYHLARDFEPAEVEEGAITDLDDHFLVREPNNLAAIHSIGITRSLRWGNLVEIFLPDERSFRGQRGVDASLLTGSLAPYPLWPMHPETISTLNAGRFANDGKPPETIQYQGKTIDNPRKDAPLGSMLGTRQKEWLKTSLKNSDVAWKVLCNSTPMLRFGLDVSFREGEPEAGLLWTDSWDGYPVERTELMEFLLEEKLTNVVSLTGDRHAHFAGMIYDDFDAEKPRPVIPEFACASTSAGCRAKVHALEIQHDPALKPLFLSIKDRNGEKDVMLPTLNAWLLFGAEAARALHETGEAEAAMAAAKPQINPHLSYADTDAYGYLIARYLPDQMEVEFVTIPEPLSDPGTAGPRVERRVSYSIGRWEAGSEPKLSDPAVIGKPPLCGLKRA
ncbi:alkaline phosphatase D family protein [Elongatibacter sediminis]|uniref:Alkaline phosphatase D family protein n=1 Tax=Elongatibacter sediminis TaxID=3119006 RepID=A0AAW9RLV3_9GAMM